MVVVKNHFLLFFMCYFSLLYPMHLRMGRSMPRISRNAPTRSYSHAKQPELKTLKKKVSQNLILEQKLEKQYYSLARTFDACYLHGCQNSKQKCIQRPECMRLLRDTHALWKQIQHDTCRLEQEIAVQELPPSIFKRKK